MHGKVPPFPGQVAEEVMDWFADHEQFRTNSKSRAAVLSVRIGTGAGDGDKGEALP